MRRRWRRPEVVRWQQPRDRGARTAAPPPAGTGPVARGRRTDMPGTWLLGSEQTATDGDRTEEQRPRALLLGLRADDTRADGDGDADPLDELERLAATDGVDVAGRLVQNRSRPDPATYLGSGKVDELAGMVRDQDAALVIADGELSPAQVRNLEERLGARVVDRTALILDIFAQHARSSEGKAQVELAQLAYQLPRLRGQGTELSRIGGGRTAGGAGTGVRGPGEMRLETQRRDLRRRMTLLRRQVQRTAARRQRTRIRRRSARVPSVALAGYTNAGKSALLNRLTGADGRGPGLHAHRHGRLRAPSSPPAGGRLPVHAGGGGRRRRRPARGRRLRPGRGGPGHRRSRGTARDRRRRPPRADRAQQDRRRAARVGRGAAGPLPRGGTRLGAHRRGRRRAAHGGPADPG